MADINLWKRRVEQWRASGLSSKTFCAGKGFSPGGLRYWAHRLQGLQGQEPQPSAPATPSVRPVRLVRVERARSQPGSPRRPARPEPPAPTRPGTPLLLEVGGTRLTISPGFDPATLTAVLDALLPRKQTARRSS